MTDDLHLPGKWRLKAHGQTLILKKRKLERSGHVIMKGLLWALYLPQYPALQVEVPVGLRYKPDLVARHDNGDFLFWAEAGRVGVAKVKHLLTRYRQTHFAFAKWDRSIHHWQRIIGEIVAETKREAAVELMAFPSDSMERFVNDLGEVQVDRQQLQCHTW